MLFLPVRSCLQACRNDMCKHALGSQAMLCPRTRLKDLSALRETVSTTTADEAMEQSKPAQHVKQTESR